MTGTADDHEPPAEEPNRPLMPRDVARVESAIEQAVARGDFDDLPGAGKPLRLPDAHDPDWWIKQRIAEGDVEREALLPPVVLLRREHGRLQETLAELRDEQAVRDYAEDYNDRVRSDRLANPMARMLAPEIEPEEAVDRWRSLRAEATTTPKTPEVTPPRTGRRPQRRWWPFRRRR